jgi:hypothetical protein
MILSQPIRRRDFNSQSLIPSTNAEDAWLWMKYWGRPTDARWVNCSMMTANSCRNPPVT